MSERFVSIGGGHGSTCGLRPDGSAVCWGRYYPREVSPPERERFAALGVGEYHVCGLRPDGNAACWGVRLEGSPPENQGFVSLSSGLHYTCGLRSDGSVSCWATLESGNEYGQASPPANERFAVGQVEP